MKWEKPIIEDRYRYVHPIDLGGEGGEVAVIQINPSLDDGLRSDPTVGKVTKWARKMKYGSIYFLNFFAIRGPRQEEIDEMGYDALVGPRNDPFILKAVDDAQIFIATGKPKGILKEYYDRREGELRHLLNGRNLHQVGKLNEDGYPRYGLS